MNHRLIILFIITLSGVIPLYMYLGATDPFASLHAASIEQLVHLGHGDEKFLSSIPGYYTTGAVIALICNIEGNSIIYLPIQLIPLALVFFILLQKLSSNVLFCSLMVLALLISDTSGNKILFWPHGLGLILFLTAIFLMIELLTNKNNILYLVPSILTICSLIFISYDLAIMTGMVLFILATLLILKSRKSKERNETYNRSQQTIITLVLIYFITLLGLSGFVYETLLPSIKTPGFIENPLSGFDKVIALFSHEVTPTDNFLYLTFPTLVSILSLIKYMILGSSIIIALYIILKSKQRNGIFLIVFSFVIMSLIYMAIRSLIGSPSLAILFFPGVICLALISQSSPKRRNKMRFVNNTTLCILLAFSLTIMTFCSLFVNYNDNLINRDMTFGNKINAPSGWYFSYKGDGIAISDIQTQNEMLYYYISHFDEKPSEHIFQKYSYFQDMNRTQFTYIYNIIENKYSTNGSYYILNYNLGYILIDNWKFLKSWDAIDSKVQINTNLNKIYSGGGISIVR